MPTMYRHFTDQAEIDAQYNAGASVRDYEDFLKRWEMSSQAAREELPCHLNVAYGQTRAETLDIFPAEVSSAPVQVFFHGGYWRSLFDGIDFAGLPPSSGGVVEMGAASANGAMVDAYNSVRRTFLTHDHFRFAIGN